MSGFPFSHELTSETWDYLGGKNQLHTAQSEKFYTKGRGGGHEGDRFTSHFYFRLTAAQEMVNQQPELLRLILKWEVVALFL